MTLSPTIRDTFTQEQRNAQEAQVMAHIISFGPVGHGVDKHTSPDIIASTNALGKPSNLLVDRYTLCLANSSFKL